MGLSDHVIVVAGGEGLLGKAIVATCRQWGATVISADVKPVKDGVMLDIGNEQSIHDCVEAVWKKYGQIDGWVNSAYPRSDDWSTPFEDVPAESFKKNFDTHLLGYILCCRTVLEKMKTKKTGSVVNISSIYGVVAPDFTLYEGTEIKTSPAAYAAIKGGLIQMSRYLASYYGKYNLRVNAVSPGGIFDGHAKEFLSRYEKKTPLGRMAKPDDISPAVAFLLSDQATYITGQNLVIDGGLTAV